MPRYRYREYDDTDAHEIEANRIGHLSGHLFADVAGITPATANVPIDPVTTFEVQEADGSWRSLADAFFAVTRRHDPQVLWVAWQSPANFLRVGTHTFRSWAFEKAKPPVVRFAHTQELRRGTAVEVYGLVYDSDDGAWALLRTDVEVSGVDLPVWVEPGRCLRFAEDWWH
jgi:hypothetical protein